GMRKRAAIARVWALGSPIVLMDEPFTVVEEELRPHLREQLRALWQESGKTIVFITENADEAAALAHRVIVLSPNPGRISADVHASSRVPNAYASGSGLYVAEEAAGFDCEAPRTQAPPTPLTEQMHSASTEQRARAARENFRQA